VSFSRPTTFPFAIESASAAETWPATVASVAAALPPFLACVTKSAFRRRAPILEAISSAVTSLAVGSSIAWLPVAGWPFSVACTAVKGSPATAKCTSAETAWSVSSPPLSAAKLLSLPLPLESVAAAGIIPSAAECSPSTELSATHSAAGLPPETVSAIAAALIRVISAATVTWPASLPFATALKFATSVRFPGRAENKTREILQKVTIAICIFTTTAGIHGADLIGRRLSFASTKRSIFDESSFLFPCHRFFAF
jgi:hypothetical protein